MDDRIVERQAALSLRRVLPRLEDRYASERMADPLRGRRSRRDSIGISVSSSPVSGRSMVGDTTSSITLSICW